MTAFVLILLLSNVQADQKAKSLWGPGGWTKQMGQRAQRVRFQVGCTMNDKRVLVAEAVDSWDAAFSKVNLATNGPRRLTAVARDEAGNQTETTVVTVYACNP